MNGETGIMEPEKKGMKDGLIRRGSKWYYVVRVRDSKTGQMKNQWKGGFATRTEAKIARNDARVASDNGTAVSATRITVGEYLEEWLEVQASQVRPTTLVSYRLHVDKYIGPKIGAERLQQLMPMMIERLYMELQKTGRRRKRQSKDDKEQKVTGLSVTTVKHIRATLHKALSDAVRKRLIPYNPCDAAEAPKIESDSDGAGEMHTWTREELDKFLASVESDRLFPMWRLAAWTGMRRGEVAGVTWRDVDLEAGTITVQRARVTVKGGDVRESKPKTRTGRRQVELDKDTRTALEEWQKRQETDRDKWPGEWPTHGLVFTQQDGSELDPDYLTRAFRAHVKRAEVPPIRLHDLRHSHATLLLAGGTPVKVVSERLGHSTPAFTMAVYQHVLPGMQRDAVQMVADAKSKAARHLSVVNE